MQRIPYKWLLIGPALAFAIGFTLNAIVVALNGGTMPVLMPSCGPDSMVGDSVHSCMSHATHLRVLADWILIRDVGIASPGDFLEWAGGAVWDYALAAWVALVLRDNY